MPIPENPLALADWRRKTADLYSAVRSTGENDIETKWRQWRTGRDRLLKSHSQSPLSTDLRTYFRALSFFDYDPSWRVLAQVELNLSPETFVTNLGEDGETAFSRVARAKFSRGGRDLRLDIFWIEGYGGGLFVPFGDSTNGTETFGGGRYLIDTIKGADYGLSLGDLVLDFNFAYNPSCAYHARWICPLAPPESRLEIAVRAGEKAFEFGVLQKE